MTSRWESSKKSLFVKTIWTNGYRHAILFKEDPVANKSPRISTSQSARLSKISSANNKSNNNKIVATKTQRTHSKRDISEDLEMTAFQLLLAGNKSAGNNNNNSGNNDSDAIHDGLKRSADRSPSKNLMKSYTFDFIRCTINTNTTNEINNENLLSPKVKPLTGSFSCDIACNSALEQCSNSLTNRVLLWLDLTGRYAGEITPGDNNNDKAQKKGKNCQTKRNFDPDSNYHDIEHALREIPAMEEQQKSNDEIINIEDSILHTKVFKSREATVEDVKKEKRTDAIKGSNVPPPTSTSKSGKIKSSSQSLPKRQVHVFIPDIARKINDCNSEYSNSILSAELIEIL